jgi:hypothetical protein
MPMKGKILIAAMAMLAGTATGYAQADNPPGAKYQTERNRSSNGLPEKPVAPEERLDRTQGMGPGAAGARLPERGPPGSEIQDERARTSNGLPPKGGQ